MGGVPAVRGHAVTALLYVFAFIGAWYCLAVATLLALVGAREWRQERRDGTG